MSDQLPDGFREAVAGLTGVPLWMLTGESPNDIWQSARTAVEWKEATGPQLPSRPPTAALPASVVTSADRVEMPHQVTTQDELRRLSPAQRMQAYREGRLMHLGANPPQPRRIGLSGAPTRLA